MQYGKKTIIMLAGHEPTLDPRIDWEAGSAAAKFEVIVCGIKQSINGVHPDYELKNGYHIQRFERSVSLKSLAFYFRYLYLLLPQLSKNFLKLGLILLSPFLLTVAILLTFAGMFYKAIIKLMRQIYLNYFKLKQFLFAIRVRGLFYHLERKLKKLFDKNLFFTYIHHYFAPNVEVFWNYIRSLEKKPDIIHCNDLDTLLVGILAKKKYGCTVIYDAHEFFPHADYRFNKITRLLFKYYEKFLVRKIDYAVTVNHLLASKMEEEYKFPFIAVPNAEPYGAKKNIEPNGLLQIASSQLKFLFQGNFASERGIEELLIAWQQIDPRQAILFLRGCNGPAKDKCVLLATQLGLINKAVFFLNPVAEYELVRAAAEADIGIIPYKTTLAGYKYACPNKLSQYMQAGLAILSNNLPFVMEVIESSAAGLIYDVKNKGTLISAIEALINNPALVSNYKKNALQYAKDHFNWQKFYPTLENLYDKAKTLYE